MERQSLNVFCKVFTYLQQMKYNVKDDLWESLDEEKMTHVLILYFRYFAQTNLAATILLEVGSCHICRNFIIGGWRWLQPVLFPGQAAPAHLLQEDDDAGDQLRPSLLQLEQSGRRPERICFPILVTLFFLFLPDKHLCLAKSDVFEELPVLKKHPVHHLL